jgi:hypothetical protein
VRVTSLSGRGSKTKWSAPQNVAAARQKRRPRRRQFEGIVMRRSFTCVSGVSPVYQNGTLPAQGAAR